MKRIIALILACALVVPSLCACSEQETEELIREIGKEVVNAVENSDELESVVTDIVGPEIESIAKEVGNAIEEVEGQTEAPTEAQTEAETEAATEAVTEVKTEAATEAVKKAAPKAAAKAAQAETEKATEKETEKKTEKEEAAALEAAATVSEIAATISESKETESKATEIKAVESEATESEATDSEADRNYSDDASGFVMVNKVADKIIQDMRYYSLYNELEIRLPGYEQPVLLLTKEAAEAIKKASDALYEDGYILKILDAYRPKAAQDKLDEEGMGSILADHVRGSAVDVTLVDRKTGKEVDMSECPYGFIDKEDLALTDKQKANQQILRKAMEKAGFAGDDEWYHFVLKDEPYKDTYFTFPINFKVAGKTAEEYLKPDKDRERRLKFIIEFYDDGTVEFSTAEEADSAAAEDKE